MNKKDVLEQQSDSAMSLRTTIVSFLLSLNS